MAECDATNRLIYYNKYPQRSMPKAPWNPGNWKKISSTASWKHRLDPCPHLFLELYIYIYLYCSTMGNAPRLKDESFPICCLICTLVQYILLMGQVMRFNTHQDLEGVLGSAHHTCKSPVSQLVARSSPVLQRKVA